MQPDQSTPGRGPSLQPALLFAAKPKIRKRTANSSINLICITGPHRFNTSA
jgi:hypothetical protein